MTGSQARCLRRKSRRGGMCGGTSLLFVCCEAPHMHMYSGYRRPYARRWPVTSGRQHTEGTTYVHSVVSQYGTYRVSNIVATGEGAAPGPYVQICDASLNLPVLGYRREVSPDRHFYGAKQRKRRSPAVSTATFQFFENRRTSVGAVQPPCFCCAT